MDLFSFEPSQTVLPRSDRKFTPIKGRGKGPRKTGFKRPAPSSVKPQPSKRPRTRHRATIEELPTEILQRILLLSRELNFPRASLVIGYRLSPKSFLSEMVLQAFAPTWDNWFGCLKRNVISYHGWLDDKERFGGDQVFQVSSNHLRYTDQEERGADVSILFRATFLPPRGSSWTTFIRP
jgi:hypothetical protein